MDWVKYDYTSTWNDEGQMVISKPFLGIEVRSNGKVMPQIAIIDSGADFTLMDAEVAAFLEIDLTECKKKFLGGIIGDSVECYQSEVVLKVSGFDNPIKIPVFFVPNLQINTLLGQHTFFDKFDIKFQKNLGAFHLLMN